MVLYADILFIVNFAMDFIILFVSGKILARKIKLKNIIFASFLGGIYANVYYILGTDGVFSAVLNILVSFLLCYIAFDIPSLYMFVKLLFMFFSVSLLLGGIFTAAYDFFTRMNFLNKSGFSVFLILIMVLSSVIFCYTAGKIFALKQSEKSIDIEISHNKKSLTLSLLCDSGNLLKDPYSLLPVIVVSEKKLKNTFNLDFAKKDELVSLRYRLIPINTASGKSIMNAIRPEGVYLLTGKKRQQIDAIIAIDGKNNDYGGKDGIINGNLITLSK